MQPVEEVRLQSLGRVLAHEDIHPLVAQHGPQVDEREPVEQFHPVALHKEQVDARAVGHPRGGPVHPGGQPGRIEPFDDDRLGRVRRVDLTLVAQERQAGALDWGAPVFKRHPRTQRVVDRALPPHDVPVRRAVDRHARQPALPVGQQPVHVDPVRGEGVEVGPQRGAQQPGRDAIAGQGVNRCSGGLHRPCIADRAGQVLDLLLRQGLQPHRRGVDDQRRAEFVVPGRAPQHRLRRRDELPRAPLGGVAQQVTPRWLRGRGHASERSYPVGDPSPERR